MNDQPTTIESQEVPQIDSKEEAVAYAIKNWNKVIVLGVAFTLCTLLLVGGVLYFITSTNTKVSTPIGTVEKK